jgi:exodeoxyribonuclease V gamma subunit
MDDRYQFLEALVAARENLYLSYIGQSIKNNEPIPPSVVVTELLEVLEGAYVAGGRVTTHPLHPFSSRYFSGESERLFSYDDNSCQVAKRLQQPKSEQQGWWHGQRQVVREDISVRELLSFYSNPQRWFVRDCLGIRLEGDIEVVAESEVFEHTTLEDYSLNQELLERCLRHDNSDVMLSRLQAEGRWPLGIPGAISYENKIRELSEFAARVAGLALGGALPDLAVELEVAGYRLTGRLANLHQGGILLCRYGSLAGRDLLGGWLHYLLHERATGCAVDSHILARDGHRLFAAGSGTAPDLETMVEVFLRGCRQPSRLYIEPGIAWVKKAEKGGTGMLEAAQENLIKTLEKGYSRETALLLRGCDLATVLGEEFEELSAIVLQPVWRRANGR